MEQTSLSSVYFGREAAAERYKSLLSLFGDSFEGWSPDFIARSPGRVNIIGDHVDYSYFPCIPASIENDVVMAAQVVDDKADPGYGKVQLVNTNHKFAPYAFDAASDVKIQEHTWANYFKCSWITSLKLLGLSGETPIKGLRVAVTGNVPKGGGLSSSAAMVVTGCLVVLRAQQKDFAIDKSGLVRLSSTCEQLVGVNSGGLDQAASVFGEKDHALFVSFKPQLNVRPVIFDQTKHPFDFLIANSLVVSNKLETAPVHYNLRVVEVSVAAQVLAKLLDVEIPLDGNLNRGTLYGVLTSKFGTVSPATLHQMLNIVDAKLKKEPYTEQEAADILGLSVAEFKQSFTSAFRVRHEGLKLYHRAKHVYEETLRVFRFERAMSSGAHPQVLGALMNESQASAETQYENSHPDCEDLCRIARAAGSLGSRVTGAGWGGCTVHLVEKNNVHSVFRALKEQYYDARHPNAPADALVVTRPGGGSAVFADIHALLQ